MKAKSSEDWSGAGNLGEGVCVTFIEMEHRGRQVPWEVVSSLWKVLLLRFTFVFLGCRNTIPRFVTKATDTRTSQFPEARHLRSRGLEIQFPVRDSPSGL